MVHFFFSVGHENHCDEARLKFEKENAVVMKASLSGGRLTQFRLPINVLVNEMEIRSAKQTKCSYLLAPTSGKKGAKLKAFD